eukprot:1147280-Pelagomonas_calceolata.AAC.18
MFNGVHTCPPALAHPPQLLSDSVTNLPAAAIFMSSSAAWAVAGAAPAARCMGCLGVVLLLLQHGALPAAAAAASAIALAGTPEEGAGACLQDRSPLLSGLKSGGACFFLLSHSYAFAFLHGAFQTLKVEVLVAIWGGS